MGKTIVVKLLASILGSPVADDISKWTNRAVRETEALTPQRHFDSLCYLLVCSLNAYFHTKHIYCDCVLLHICYLLYISKWDLVKVPFIIFNSISIVKLIKK